MMSDARHTVAIQLMHPAMGKRFALPAPMTAQAAGYDLVAAIDVPVQLATGARQLLPCGFGLALPDGFEAQVRSRSGLALRHGVVCLNSPGTLDADYRGEVHALLANFGQDAYTITPGERIAQMIFARLPAVQLQVVTQLPTTARGSGAFGSTGKEGRRDG